MHAWVVDIHSLKSRVLLVQELHTRHNSMAVLTVKEKKCYCCCWNSPPFPSLTSLPVSVCLSVCLCGARAKNLMKSNNNTQLAELARSRRQQHSLWLGFFALACFVWLAKNWALSVCCSSSSFLAARGSKSGGEKEEITTFCQTNILPSHS